jgi:hypothetical protein
MADEGQALVPVREQVIDFYGDPVPVAQAGPDELYVPLRALATFLGLSVSGSRQRVMRDPVLARRVRQVRISGADGKRYETLCVPLDLLPGWLFGIDTRRVKAELQDRLNLYRAECFRVLWRAFQNEIMPTPPPPADLNPAEQALMIAEAVASLARSHLEQTGRIDALEQRQTTMADYLRPFVPRTNERLTALELRLSSGATINEDQATEIALAVKNVAHLLQQRGTANPYQQVWGELYRRFRVGAYRNLPATRFDEALAWLQGWYGELGQSQDQGTW